MQFKYILFYSLLVLIVLLTALGMVYISNHYESKNDYDNIINEVLKKEAKKMDENKEWVYDFKKNDEVIIPTINIKDEDILAINESMLEYDYTDVLNASYLYSINADLLSILYTKTYLNYKEYEIYNINLGSTKIITGVDAIEYINQDINSINNVVSLTINKHLKNLNLPDELFNEYFSKTMDNYNNQVNNNSLMVYLGSNKEVNILVDIITDKEEQLLINIVDKN